MLSVIEHADPRTPVNNDLHHFLARLIGVVGFTLIPVILTAFVAMPMSLNRHPGEPVGSPTAASQHLT
jgi:hypothetical protein